MYIYDEYDQALVNQRVEQFRQQTQRYLNGELGEEEYRPLRLMNGLYIQRHAPMLRVAIPYGLLSSAQLRMFAHIARTYDKGYGHITTRQNIQFNWPELARVPDILADLASVQMHAIQTSGNCIRNVTSDQFAGVAKDEAIDPRPYCEIIRQWSTLHPEFSYLPRKFKIAVSGAITDRAACLVHDIGLYVKHNDQGEVGFSVYVGGGLGRTPIIGQLIRDFLPEQDLLTYLEAILRVYNRYGRRDNKYKARIKILVKSLKAAKFAEQVEAEWAQIKDSPLTLDPSEVARIQAFFTPFEYDPAAADDKSYAAHLAAEPGFARWQQRNLVAHKQPGYHAVYLSLKKPGLAPGDMTAEQMDQVADLADRYSFGQLRATHSQNLVLADVKQADLYPLWQTLRELGLATPSVGTLTDMICCPGLDFCSLANARSLNIAADIQQRFDDLDYLYDIGDLRLNISGCMNACGHHHVGNIGILGVDKKGEEFYQVSLGGSSHTKVALGQIIGPSFSQADIGPAIETIVSTYLEHREDGESFVEAFNRIGIQPFKEQVYARH